MSTVQNVMSTTDISVSQSEQGSAVATVSREGARGEWGQEFSLWTRVTVGPGEGVTSRTSKTAPAGLVATLWALGDMSARMARRLGKITQNEPLQAVYTSDTVAPGKWGKVLMVGRADKWAGPGTPPVLASISYAVVPLPEPAQQTSADSSAKV